MRGNQITAVLMAIAASALAAPATADEVPVYDYIAIGGVWQDADAATGSERGVVYDVSWSFAERFRFIASAGEVGSASSWEAGFGYHVLTGETTSVFLDYARFAVDDFPRFNADGTIIRLGLRNRVASGDEIRVMLENRDSVQIEETVFGVGWRHYWTERLNSGFSVGVGSDATEYRADLRLDF